MMMMIMTIESVEQRPGWGEHVKTQSNHIRARTYDWCLNSHKYLNIVKYV